MSDLALTVKQELQRIMLQEGVSQNELHRRTGIAQTHISRILREDAEVTTATIEILAEGLGLKPRIVFERTAEHAHVA